MTTAHINAKKGDFSDIVLMPGDPIRAKFIAQNYLDKTKLISDVRNMLGYTGYYKGRKISVMAHGMGIPSCSIYTTELIKYYDVKKIIRLGSCSSVRHDIKVNDVVMAMSASTDSNVNRIRFQGYDFSVAADYYLLKHAEEAAKNNDIKIWIGNMFSTDFFYAPKHHLGIFDLIAQYGFVGAEMEAAGFYGLAAEYGAKALTICTVCEHMLTGEKTLSQERVTSAHQMTLIALESVLLGDNEKEM